MSTNNWHQSVIGWQLIIRFANKCGKQTVIFKTNIFIVINSIFLTKGMLFNLLKISKIGQLLDLHFPILDHSYQIKICQTLAS